MLFPIYLVLILCCQAAWPVKTNKRAELCDGEKEMIFALQFTSPVSQDDFQSVATFVTDMIDEFQENINTSRLAIVCYLPGLEKDIQFDECKTLDDLKTAVKELGKQITADTDSNHKSLADAIFRASSFMSTPSPYNKIILTVTDSEANTTTDSGLRMAVEATRDNTENIVVVSVGGRKVKKTLKEIASVDSPVYIYGARNVNELPSIVRSIGHNLCLGEDANTYRAIQKDLNTTSANVMAIRQVLNTTSVNATATRGGLNTTPVNIMAMRQDMNMSANVTATRQVLNTTSVNATSTRGVLNTTSVNATTTRGVLNTTSANVTATRQVLNGTSANVTAIRRVLNATSANVTATRQVLNTTSANVTATRQVLNTTSGNTTSAATREVLNTTSSNATATRQVLNTTSANATATQQVLNTTSSNATATRQVLNVTSVNVTAMRQASVVQPDCRGKSIHPEVLLAGPQVWRAKNLTEVIRFVENVIAAMDVRPNISQLRITAPADGELMPLILNQSLASLNAVSAMLSKIQIGNRKSSVSLSKMKDSVFAKAEKGAGELLTTRVVIVIHAGPFQPRDVNHTKVTAQRLKDDGFKIVAIGINGTNPKDLENIASTPLNGTEPLHFEVGNYSALINIEDMVAQRVCRGKWVEETKQDHVKDVPKSDMPILYAM